ncbi:MAG: hypothetical protein AB9819_01855 [Methanomassiliicoccales archaeon]
MVAAICTVVAIVIWSYSHKHGIYGHEGDVSKGPRTDQEVRKDA